MVLFLQITYLSTFIYPTIGLLLTFNMKSRFKWYIGKVVPSALSNLSDVENLTDERFNVKFIVSYKHNASIFLLHFRKIYN